MRYRNNSTERRVWINLTDPDTGRTLELDSGDEVDLDRRDIDDPHLKPVAIEHAHDHEE